MQNLLSRYRDAPNPALPQGYPLPLAPRAAGRTRSAVQRAPQQGPNGLGPARCLAIDVALFGAPSVECIQLNRWQANTDEG